MKYLDLFLLLVIGGACTQLFYGPYRDFRVDLLRHRLFRVRDDLFDSATRGEFGPAGHNDPAYLFARRLLNGMIRFAHDVSIWRFALLFATKSLWESPHAKEEFTRHYRNALEDSSPSGRKAFSQALAWAHLLLLAHVLNTSAMTFPFVIVVKTFAFVLANLLSLVDLIRWFIDRQSRGGGALVAIDREAYTQGA